MNWLILVLVRFSFSKKATLKFENPFFSLPTFQLMPLAIFIKTPFPEIFLILIGFFKTPLMFSKICPEAENRRFSLSSITLPEKLHFSSQQLLEV